MAVEGKRGSESMSRPGSDRLAMEAVVVVVVAMNRPSSI